VSYPPYSPPPGQYPQGDGYPPPDGYPASAGYPVSGYPDAGGYPASAGYPVSGYPDAGGYQQPGSYPPAESYQQGSYQQGGYQPDGYQPDGYQPQPGYQQPGGYQPYGQPPPVVAPVVVGAPPPAKPGKSSAPTVLLIVGVCVFVFLALCGFGIWRFYVSAKDIGTHTTTSTKYSVGDCLNGQSEDSITEVSCSGPHEWEVVGVIPGVYESEATGEACAARWSSAEAAYWYGVVGSLGTSYCLAPAQ
jgi:hypothetical protein